MDGVGWGTGGDVEQLGWRAVRVKGRGVCVCAGGGGLKHLGRVEALGSGARAAVHLYSPPIPKGRWSRVPHRRFVAHKCRDDGTFCAITAR